MQGNAPQTSSATTTSAVTAGQSVPASAPATAAEMYRAMQLQRRVVEEQLEELTEQRERIASELRNEAREGADRAGLETQLQEFDQRIVETQGRLATARQQESSAAAEPGSTVPPVYDPRERRDDLIESFGYLFLFVCVLPLSIAFARRMVRRPAAPARPSPELMSRLDSIERAVETTAVEVERIGEGQRFVTQLMARQNAGAALPAQQESPR